VDTHLPRQVQPEGGSGKLGPFDSVMSSIGTLPRPALLAIVGVVVVGGVFLVTHKPSSTPSSTPAPTQTPKAAESHTAKSGSSANATQPKQGKQNATPASQSKAGPAGPGLPVSVKHALDAHKTVVILFWNRRAVDDRSVKTSVDRLPHRKHLAVFSDGVRNLSRYTRITAAASVSTTPSLVIVNPKGQAEVVAGYLDYATIRQYIQNSLRR
jgi:hypothetical protein